VEEILCGRDLLRGEKVGVRKEKGSTGERINNSRGGTIHKKKDNSLGVPLLYCGGKKGSYHAQEEERKIPTSSIPISLSLEKGEGGNS